MDSDKIKKMEELANKNDSNAQNDLGVYIMERASTKTEEEQAVSWFYKAAKQGNSRGMMNLGMATLVGKGTERDIKSALFLIESAFLMGIDHAIKFLISAIQNSDVDKKELLELSSDGDMRAKWIVGICLDHGICMSKNTEEAYRCFTESAEDDNPVAL